MAEQVGDVNSQEKGSGARYNGGKPAMELIPVWLISGVESSKRYSDDRKTQTDEALSVLYRLGEWQKGRLNPVDLMTGLDRSIWADCARVFDYGRKKYAEWNWAKGMKWSVALACCVRHCLAILDGEDTDPESGLPHRGHIACNLIMIMQYEETYREGDDRPIKWLSNDATVSAV